MEVNPPRLPSMLHSRLRGRWRRVLITDNPFKEVRVSPYAFAARITHDVPDVRPTVVCSTRDRNILAIESEVRGALGNGVDSFLVVQGDMLPEVEHWSNSYEIVEHLRALQEQIGPGALRGRHEHPLAAVDVPAPDRGGRPVLHDRTGHGSGVGARHRRAPPAGRCAAGLPGAHPAGLATVGGAHREGRRHAGRRGAPPAPGRHARRASSASWAGASPRPWRRRRARRASRAS